jgi:hypothetical protein
MPTPVGPLGPDEIDPNDPDHWDWDAESSPPPGRPVWIRITAGLGVLLLIAFVLSSLAR